MVGFPPVTEILGITCNKQISKKYTMLEEYYCLEDY